MKNRKNFIIGFVLIFILSMVPSGGQAKILDECKWTDFDKITEDSVKDDLSFRLSFEKAKDQYHRYINCVFDGASDGVLSQLGGAKKTCLSDGKAKKYRDILADGSPQNLLKPLLAKYHLYTDYLNQLNAQWASELVSEDYVDGIERQQKLKRLINSEVQHALIALDNALVGLTEMRQAYVMHQHFSCMIVNLQSYQQVLGALRSAISVMPSLFHNASTHAK